MNTSQCLLLIAACCVAGVGGGCRAEPAAPSLFVEESPMHRDRHHAGVYQRFTPQGQLQYTRCLVERVVFLPSDAPRDPQLSDRLSDQFRRELVARLASDFQVVAHPGAGVLRIQPAIIYGKLGPGYDLSEAHMETLITDSVTGEHIMALADTRPHYQSTGGSLFSDWENARSVLEAWSALIRQKASYVNRP